MIWNLNFWSRTTGRQHIRSYGQVETQFQTMDSKELFPFDGPDPRLSSCAAPGLAVMTRGS